MHNALHCVVSGFIVMIMAKNMTAEPPEKNINQSAHALYVKLALKGITQEYPNKLEHVLTGSEDLKSPQQLHPVFYGSYDWHSCVHGHWLLAHLLRTDAKLPEAKTIRAIFSKHFTESNVKVEVAYFQRPLGKSFERPYGWTWLLKLHEELLGWDDAEAKQWCHALQPLAEIIAARYIEYFPKQTYPIRSGVHNNTAFGMTFAYDYAVKTQNGKLQTLIEERAKHYYLNDHDAPAQWEPSGADFLSPTLCEADLMRRVLPKNEFAKWFHAFLPKIETSEPALLFTPAIVTDRTDPQLVHLDGLNLSRAWAMQGIANALPESDPARAILIASGKKHEEAGRKHIASGDYAGEHWLASFAVYGETHSAVKK